MNDNGLDELDEELRMMFERTGPRRAPVDVEQIMTSTVAEPSGSTRNAWRKRWKTTLRAAAFVAVATILVLILRIRTTSLDSYAFAQVQEQVEQARTVDYIETTISLDDPTQDAFNTRFRRHLNAQSVLKMEISSLESRLAAAGYVEKNDIELRLSLLKPLLGEDLKQLPDDIRRVRIKGKHLQRTDHIFPFGQLHGVINARTGESVTFNHKQKTMEVLKTQVVINSRTGETSERPVNITPAVDFFKRFRAIPAEATQRLPLRKIGGEKAIGFRSIESRDDGLWTRTYWVHPESKLPIQMITEFRSAKKGLGSSRWVKERFVFDAELDDALFATETPDGYESKDGKLIGIEL